MYDAATYKTWIDENNIGLTIENYQDALVIDLYFEDEDGNDKSMEFTFKRQEELEEFIARLNYLKNYVWV